MTHIKVQKLMSTTQVGGCAVLIIRNVFTFRFSVFLPNFVLFLLVTPV